MFYKSLTHVISWKQETHHDNLNMFFEGNFLLLQSTTKYTELVMVHGESTVSHAADV